MGREDALSLISSEFKLWGVKFAIDHTGSNHYRLQWQVTPDKEVRTYFIAKTPSDGRGTLNARAEIRRLFKADGLILKEQCARPKPVLQKALAIPEPVERDADQIRMLRAEVGDLSEMLLEAVTTITAIVKDLAAAQSAAIAAPPPPAPAPVEPKPSVRSVKTIDFVSDAWSSTEAIARDMELPANIAYRKLYYLAKQQVIELSGGRWRKKPPVKVLPLVAAGRKTKLNGHKRHHA